jgi:hypothetical protein
VQKFVSDSLPKLREFVEKAGARHSKRDLTMLQGVHDNAVALGAACGDLMEKSAESAAAAATTETPAAVETTTTEKAATTEQPAAAAAAAPADAAATEQPAAAPAEPVAKAAGDAVPAPLTLDSISALITKAVSDATTPLVTQLEEAKATSAATIASLQEQITKMSSEPQHGGPVANANAAAIAVVEKGLAAGGGGFGSIDDVEVAKQVIGALVTIGEKSTDPVQKAALAEEVMSLQLKHRIGATAIPMPSLR